MVLPPFTNNQLQKIVSLITLIIGIILIFNSDNKTLGTILSLFGLVYLLDSLS